VIGQMLAKDAWRNHRLYNLNIPTAATQATADDAELRVCRMGATRWDAAFEERKDPKGRRYFWTIGTPPAEPPGADTDIAAIDDGALSLTPPTIERTDTTVLADMATWNFGVTVGATG